MPLLEQVTPDMLKKYPYFWTWIQELGRTAEEVADFSIAGHVKEVPSDTMFKKFEPTGDFTATLVFKDGTILDRDGKWSDGTMVFVPGEDEVKP